MRDNRPQEILRVFSKADINKLIFDHRFKKSEFTFGNIVSLCNQFGIKAQKVEGGHIFYAPKLRLQKFIEKLHFSNTHYQILK